MARFSGIKGHKFEGISKFAPDGPRWTGTIRLHEPHLDLPLRWRKPRRIFVNSISDTFHERVKDDWIDRIFAVMALAPQHTFQVLTKRPKRMLRYLGQFPDRGFKVFEIAARIKERRDGPLAKYGMSIKFPLPNVWLGVSVEDQKTADERIPLLLRTPAAVRWISAEPLLGDLDFKTWLTGANALNRKYAAQIRAGTVKASIEGLDWIVAGGESGPGARPMHPCWARRLRDQCVASGTPYFFKQWGEFCPTGFCSPGVHEVGKACTMHMRPSQMIRFSDDCEVYRVGKKSAGRLLDGREWNQYPQTVEAPHA